MAQTFFEGNDIEFRGVFKVLGVEQTPVSVTVGVFKTDGTEVVANGTAAVVDTNDVTYQFNNVQEGQYKLYFEADFGNDKRSGVITYRVIKANGLSG